VCAITATNL
jgi:hypothetical protein